MIVASFVFYTLHDARLAFKQSVVALKWMPDDSVEIQFRSGDWVGAEIQPGSFVTTYLTSIAYRIPDKPFTRHVIILPDMLDTEMYRDLRVKLRWKNDGSKPAK